VNYVSSSKTKWTMTKKLKGGTNGHTLTR